jgi:hypothetical protein
MIVDNSRPPIELHFGRGAWLALLIYVLFRGDPDLVGAIVTRIMP